MRTPSADAQTAPFDLLKRRDVGAACRWEEPLVIDESLERLLTLSAEGRCLLLFELLQQPATFRRYDKHRKQFDGGVHRIAWGFLRLAGAT
eukprot:357678-Chlamydomonas_euryale.AAC.14